MTLLRLPMHWTRRPMVCICSLLILTAAMVLLALRFGSYPMTAKEIFFALSGQAEAIPAMIVQDHRLPRVLVALGAGACFGLAGVIFQTMLRNPLASPDVIGFNAGATCGALASIVITGSTSLVLPAAIAGGLGAAALVLALSIDPSGVNRLDPVRMVLIGVGVGLALGALGDLLLSWTDENTAADMAQWLTGSLQSRNWQDVQIVWFGLTMVLPALIWLGFALARMGLDDDQLIGLGLALSPLRLGLSILAIILAGLAISVAGPLPFVAFIAGPIARGLVGGGKPPIVTAGLVGALVTLLADCAARMIPLYELPTGVFTALFGAPVLLWLLLAHYRKGQL